MPLDEARARRLIVAISVAGVVLRLAFGLLYWTGKPLTHDEQEYLAIAGNIGAGRGFDLAESRNSESAQQFGRAPGYPVFLAALGAGRDPAASSPARVKVAQAIAGGCIVWLVGIFAWRAGGSRAGVTAAALAAGYPPLVWTPAYVLSETVYSTAALSAALTLQVAVDRSTPTMQPRTAPLALAAGALAGAAVLIRPAMLMFLPFAAGWLIARRRTMLAAALMVAAIAVMAPWTIRNFRVYGRFVLIASEGGVTFWTGNHPLAIGEGDLAANPQIKRADLALRRAHPNLSPEELEPIYYREAFRFIAEHPGQWVALLMRKAFYTVVPAGPSYAVHSTRYRATSVISYMLLLPVAVTGGRLLWRAPRPPTALFLVSGSALLVCLVFFPQERFRIPILDPALVVCAAGNALEKQRK
jgi:hypothetical protein